MIRRLVIRNLILIEQAEIRFGSGLNVITGETGAGKSAVLAAIRLILGERADHDLIRKGADLAIVEAEVSGLLVRRELHRSGRSRSFVNDELVSLHELREQLCTIELVDQAAAQKLFEQQGKYLDAFGGIGNDFAARYEALKQAETRLSELLSLQQTDAREQEKMQETLTWIEETNWQDGEEERLTEEHHLLTHAQELLEKISVLTGLISELSPLKRSAFGLEQFRDLAECTEWLKTATANLDEANRFLTSYAARLEADPGRLFAVEKRLGQLESLKKRFGTYSQIEELRTSLKMKVDRFSNLGPEIEQAKAHLDSMQKETASAASALTERRKKAAFEFAETIVSELKCLNLPAVRFAIEIAPKALSQNGADEIRYLFAANPGTPLLPVNQCASGGELSRLLFALKTALAGKEGNSCLIFDEIDSNVGGKTAAILGAKLEQLSEKRQLISVTHFVQVARFAADHFLVSKKTTPFGAETTIAKLGVGEREEEYARMTGG